MSNDEKYMLDVTPLFHENMTAKERVVVNQGGTSSGKTYSIMQVLFVMGIEQAGLIMTVVGQDIPNLKKGSYRDAKAILAASEQLAMWYPTINESERIIRCTNGSIIEFSSYQDEQDARNGKRDVAFFNEANGISYEIFWQIYMRTRLKVFIDYNPSARFWVHEKLIGKPDVRLIISDHRSNRFLSEEQHDMIENIDDDELWKVYARGVTGKITGLVYTNWDIVEELPPQDEWKMVAYGLDWGFTCFRGDTLIMTSKGEVPIKDVKKGDLVLTRKGYRKVKKNIYNGYKKVIHKKFVKGLHTSDIFCTFEHNFNANGKWKKYGELTTEDRLFMLSSSTAWCLGDTHTEDTGIITITEGKRMEFLNSSYSISTYTKRSLVNCQRVWSYIIKMATLLITTLKTLLLSPLENICGFTPILSNGTENIPKNLRNDYIQNKIGKNAGKRYWLDLQQSVECVNGVEKNLHQPIHIKDFVRNVVIMFGNIKPKKIILKWFAELAERLSWVTSILNQNAVLRNAHIKWLHPNDIETKEEQWCDVYDLEIDGVHEYFANGILVHNCDPTALVKVVLAHGDLWIDELIYTLGLTNPQIATRMKENGITSRDEVIADSAEMKSIAELNGMGLHVVPCVKGAGSVNNGIDIVKRYKLHVTRRSSGLRKELLNYKWKVNKDGEPTNEPVDFANHDLDALRYIAGKKLNIHPVVKGIARRN